MTGVPAVVAGGPRSWLRLARHQLIAREERFFLLLAVLIGLFSGVLVVLFRIAIDTGRLLLLGSALQPSPARVLVIPVIGGLAVAVLALHVFPRVRGSGVNQTKAALYIYDGYIPFDTVSGKFVASSLAIGSGHSLGPEDPSLQIGAGIASLLGRRLRLPREKVRMIAPVGAAAGLSAAFNSPISAVLFVIEEVIGRWSAGVLGAVVLAAVSSVVVTRSFLGAEPLFRVPEFSLAHPAELAAYALMGIAGGLFSLVFVKLIAYTRPRLKAAPRWTQYFQPAVAGLLVGIIGLWLPQVMGAGYESIDQAMHDQYTWRVLALLAVFKMLATLFSFASGTPGGLFAPTLFMGAMLGAATGGIEHLLFPRFAASVGAFALVGMGTLFAGILRVPMTSVFMILEISGNYSIVLPVIIANTFAYLISRKYQPVPLFDMLARQDGIDLPSMEELREQAPLHVEDAMRVATAPVLSGDATITQALEAAAAGEDAFFLVRSGDTWRGITRATLLSHAAGGNGADPVASVADGPLPALHPDQPLDSALRLIRHWPVLPVVHRADRSKLEGTVTLEDVLGAYRK